MEKRLKYKSWHHKSPRWVYRQENLKYSMQQCFHRYFPYSKGHKGKNKQMGLPQKKKKKKASAQLKKTSSKWKGNQLHGKTYLPMTPQTRVWSPKYIKNSHDSTSERQRIQLKNGQSTWTDISPRRIQRAQRYMKGYQDHQTSGRCKLQPQWDTTSHWSE